MKLLVNSLVLTAVSLPLWAGAASKLQNCKQGGIDISITFPSGTKFCSLSTEIAPADTKVIKTRILELKKRYANDEEADGAGASLYFGFQEKYRASQETKDVYSVLKPEHIFTIYDYIEWGYQSMNALLWKSEALGPKVEAGSRVLTSALNQLPNFVGTVYRGDIDPIREVEVQNIASRLERLDPKKPYLFKSFMSTTTGKNEETYTRYFVNRAIAYTIQSKTGKHIAPLSSRPEEEEVLFRPNTYFKILEVKKVPREKTDEYPLDYQIQVRMEEI